HPRAPRALRVQTPPDRGRACAPRGRTIPGGVGPADALGQLNQLASFDQAILQSLGDGPRDRIAEGSGMARNRDDGHALALPILSRSGSVSTPARIRAPKGTYNAGAADLAEGAARPAHVLPSRVVGLARQPLETERRVGLPQATSVAAAAASTRCWTIPDRSASGSRGLLVPLPVRRVQRARLGDRPGHGPAHCRRARVVRPRQYGKS